MANKSGYTGYFKVVMFLQGSGNNRRTFNAGSYTYAGKYSAQNGCSLVYKGRKVALYGGAYRQSPILRDLPLTSLC